MGARQVARQVARGRRRGDDGKVAAIVAEGACPDSLNESIVRSAAAYSRDAIVKTNVM